MTDGRGRVYIVDDDPALRDAIAFLVASVGYEARLFGAAADLLAGLDDSLPACIVLDVRLPGMSGLELQRELISRAPSARIVFMSGHGDIPKAVRAIRMGAVDFLEKPFDDQMMLDRVAEALAQSASDLARRGRRNRQERRLALLTERERDVLRLVVGGRSSKAVAAELNISSKTVENHRHNIMLKAGVASVSQLIVWASEDDGIAGSG
jgi:FixJ family two-component response regulator